MFEYVCGGSTGCAIMMALSILLLVLTAASWLAITVLAFRASPAQGVLCLLIPPYAIYFGFARMDHRRRGLLMTGLLLAPVLAILAQLSATAVFGPDVTEGQPGFDEAFPEDPATDDLGDFEDDLGDFEDDLGDPGQ